VSASRARLRAPVHRVGRRRRPQPAGLCGGTPRRGPSSVQGGHAEAAGARWSGPRPHAAGPARELWTNAPDRSGPSRPDKVVLVQGRWTRAVDQPGVGPAPWTKQCVDQDRVGPRFGPGALDHWSGFGPGSWTSLVQLGPGLVHDVWSSYARRWTNRPRNGLTCWFGARPRWPGPG
jgi:hypothetical protein